MDYAPIETAEAPDLSELALDNNQISDISPLVANPGIGAGDVVYLEGNPLDVNSCASSIPTLEANGVTVYYDCPSCESIDCGEHGTCVEGICECDMGYTGDLCETFEDFGEFSSHFGVELGEVDGPDGFGDDAGSHEEGQVVKLFTREGENLRVT